MGGDICNTKIIQNVEVQENGLIRNSKGRLIAKLVREVTFEGKHINDDRIKDAMTALSKAMKRNPDYAHSWHCNIAMACYDSMSDLHEEKHAVGNEAASRFMKRCFDVETKA